MHLVFEPNSTAFNILYIITDLAQNSKKRESYLICTRINKLSDTEDEILVRKNLRVKVYWIATPLANWHRHEIIVPCLVASLKCNKTHLWSEEQQNHVLCSLSLLSAAIAAAIDAGKCLRFEFVLGFSSFSGIVNGALDSKDSTSFRVKTGWSWFFVFPLMNEWLLLLLFNLYMLSSTVSFT